ncbi:protein artichoke-like [Sitodiplosis mosellana]|uniref:protein artichoke-like n=1 Tax=Sitodiplosis mosellana TaxID=263140 RepID=UPI0024444593|nr:protein artichoke-like [Sitodiplosis mosellana]
MYLFEKQIIFEKCDQLKKVTPQKIILSIIFVLFFVKFCSSNDFECGYSDDKMESIEFYCTDYDSTVPVDCSMAFFLTIQSYNKSKVTHLKVGGCDNDQVKRLVDDMPNLLSLDLSHSRIASFDALNLTHERLVKVNASFNYLSEIPRSFFAHIPNVIEVDFSHNHLNGIIDLPDSLTYIDLSYTKISSIYQDFNDLSKTHDFALKTLRISGNPIRVFDWKILPLVKSGYSLHISWKQIREFKVWNYLDEPVRVVTNSDEEGLLHASNGTIEFHCREDSFKSINRFELIDNNIANPTDIINCLGSGLKYLTLSGEFGEQLKSTSLARFVDLKELCLHNAQLSEFDFSILKSMTKIEFLDISRNNLERVGNISFLEHAKNLIHLNVAENDLECTPELIQYVSSSVLTLRLNGNYVGKLNIGTFDKLTNLQYLYLANTSLSLDNAKPFESLKQLQTLDISHNNLENANFTSLSSSLENLRTFQAIDCKIGNASQLMKLFEKSPFLSKLDLSGNFLSELNATAFEELQYLNLSNTNLSKVDFGILEHKPKLELLDLSFNQLENVNFVSVLSYLDSLRLGRNHLKDLNTFTKSHFPRLASLDIAKNEFSCDYLTEFVAQLKQEWPHLKMINSPWEQNMFKCHPGNCQKPEVKSNETSRSDQSSKQRHSDNTFCAVRVDSSLKMKHSVVFVLFLIKFCETNDIECGRLDDTMQSAVSVEFHCAQFEGTLPVNCSSSVASIINKTNVTALKVGGCDYDSIKQIVESFPNLQEINIKQISNIGFDRVFPDNHKLRILQLERNKISEFDWRFFPLVQRASVAISWEDINEFEIIDALDKPIRIVVNSEYEESSSRNNQNDGLFQTSNGQIELHCRPMSFKAITKFKIHSNHIENPEEILRCLSPTLEVLELIGSCTEKLSSLSLEPFQKLIKLTLKSMLKDFDASAMKNQKNLVELNISQNNLTKISNAHFLNNFNDLLIFKAHENQVENTPELIQHLASGITILDLGENFVGKLNATTFVRFTNLMNLDLSNTNLSFDDLRPFEALRKLEELDISRNTLESVNFESILAFKRLQRFYATDCKIKNASKLIKLFGSSLSQLDLSGNELGAIEANTFEHIDNLNILNLSRTNLLSFDFTVIAHEIELVTVDLTKNKLENINMSSAPKHLQSLFLSGNELKEIGDLKRSNVPRLMYLSLDENQLSCEYLSTFMPRIVQEWPRLRFTSDSWQQKHKQACIF